MNVAQTQLACVCGSHEVGRPLVRGRSRHGEAVEVRPCTTCSLRRTYPPPDLAALTEGVYQNEATFADQLTHLDRFRSFAWALLDAAEKHLAPGQRRLLDVGCGIGALLLEAQARGFSASGLEINVGAARYARESLGLDVHAGALEGALARDTRYDVITMSQVLEHIEAPAVALRELSALLAPGGVIVVESPNMDGLYARILGSWWYGFAPAQHLWHFTPSTIGTIARLADLELVSVSARRCLDYPVPRVLVPLVEIPGSIFNAGDNVLAVFRPPGALPL